jgi:hypothetical protein
MMTMWGEEVGDKYMPGNVGALWSITPLSPRLTSIDMVFLCLHAEPEFLNVIGAQESIPGNRFRQPMLPGGPVL